MGEHPQGNDSPGRNEIILFWASFMTLIAAGIGFSIRGGILGAWSSQFGFTQLELGSITGGGLVGFGVTIILFSFLADRIGYGRLMIVAFLLHLSSGIVTLMATPLFNAAGKDAAYWCLWVGMFLFALGNGTCEAVINPLTATLFPNNKTHWLNILHAGWPGGLVLGALLGLLFRNLGGVRWEVQMSIFLIPTALYGLMMLGRRFPRSEASASGVSFGTMLLQFTSPILLFLILLHAMVGYVELGTDSWISKITGTIMEDADRGLMLFIWTSSLMFALRFFAGPIVHRISPLGLLLASSVLGCAGLLLLGRADTVTMCVIAATVYGIGKTFFWPTMLGVVSERYPQGGALTLGMVGGVGMLSAGLLGSPGIGYTQDYFASQSLRQAAPEVYDRYKADKPDAFLFLPPVQGLDGAKVGALLGEPGANNGMGQQLAADRKALESKGRSLTEVPEFQKQVEWWETQGRPHAEADRDKVDKARLYGSRQALIYTAAVPAMMAVGYLLLILIFAAQGGYKPVTLASTHPEGLKGPTEY